MPVTPALTINYSNLRWLATGLDWVGRAVLCFTRGFLVPECRTREIQSDKCTRLGTSCCDLGRVYQHRERLGNDD